MEGSGSPTPTEAIAGLYETFSVHPLRADTHWRRSRRDGPWSRTPEQDEQVSGSLASAAIGRVLRAVALDGPDEDARTTAAEALDVWPISSG